MSEQKLNDAWQCQSCGCYFPHIPKILDNDIKRCSKCVQVEILEAKLEAMGQVYDAAFRLAIRPGLSGGLKVFGKNLRIALAKVNLAQIRPWLSKSELAAAQEE